MIRTFQFYLENNKVVKQTPNIETAKGLLKNALERWEFFKAFPITEQNATILFGEFYEIIREATQAHLAKAGFKPYSHEATIAFMRENIDGIDEGDVEQFDRYRLLRHDCMYYGKHASTDRALAARAFLEKMLQKLKKLD